MSGLANTIMLDEAFQAALQRYAHGNGSSASVANAASRISDARIAHLEAELREKEADAERLTKERDDARRAKTGHFSPPYLLANARRVAAREYATMPNWVLATQIFAVGSTTAHTICRENGIDPDSKSVHLGAAIRGGDGGKR